jgi:hypothetical protein
MAYALWVGSAAIFLGKTLMQGDAGEYLEQPAVQVKIRETRRKLGTAQSTIKSNLIYMHPVQQ